MAARSACRLEARARVSISRTGSVEGRFTPLGVWRRRFVVTTFTPACCGAGYLRKNGVPYSEAAVVTEYYDRLSMFGNDYLQVVTVVVDPKYLLGPFAVSNQFKREPDGSKWRPTPCATDPPVGTLQRSAFVP